MFLRAIVAIVTITTHAFALDPPENQPGLDVQIEDLRGRRIINTPDNDQVNIDRQAC